MPSTEDLAYAAGIVDGEGCITASYKPKTKSCQLSVSVSVATTVIPYWLQKTFGGPDYYEELNVKGYGKSKAHKMYRWRLSGRDAQDFLITIYPYLKEKYEQAELAIAIPKKEPGQHLSNSERKLQITNALAISKLNSAKGRKGELVCQDCA